MYKTPDFVSIIRSASPFRRVNPPVGVLLALIPALAYAAIAKQPGAAVALPSPLFSVTVTVIGSEEPA
jgi:hypothetical protein